MPELHEPAIKRVDLDGATFHGASFAPARVSFFYGRNGTGKSTAARAIAGKAGLSWRGGAAAAEGFRILLFDLDFIEANFRQTGPVPGVYVLNARNAALREEIAQLARERQRVVQQGRSWADALEASQRRLEHLRTGALERCWRLTRPARKTYAAALRGLRTKASCFASLLELDHPEPVDVQTLSVLYGEVFGEEQQSYPLLARVPTLDRPCGLVEKPLASGADSPYAEFVKALGAADWVREGLERFAPRAEGVCPFCGKPLAEDFAERVAQCFDEAWHRDFAALQAFQQSYAAACSRTLATLRRNLEDPPPGLDLSACRDKIRLLEQAVEANLKALEGKLAAPLSRVELTPLDGLVAEINAGIDRANDDIRRMNGAADLAARRSECMGLVRNLMALQASGCLEAYRKSRAEAEAVMKAQAASKRELAGEYLRLTEEIAARRRACTGTARRPTPSTPGSGPRASKASFSAPVQKKSSTNWSGQTAFLPRA